MKKVLGAFAISACCIASPALAEVDADWTGAYIGIHAGYTSMKSDSTPTLGDDWIANEPATRRADVISKWSAQQKVENAHFGAQLGYNLDAGGVVVGVEADFTLHNGSDDLVRGPLVDSTSSGLSYTFGNHIDPKYAMSLRGKLGLPLGKTLVYAHGGWGWTRAEVAADIVSNGGYTKEGRVTETFDGYIIGGGIEHKVGSNASVRLEYSYADQGDVTYATAYRTGSTFAPPTYNYTETFTQDLRMHQVRIGLNYHF